MLQDFLISHRSELIRNCREKVAVRFAPAVTPDVVDHGVPLFIQQLIDALTTRPTAPIDDKNPDGRIQYPAEIGRSAALHGADLLRRGFTVDQVVHDYGDVCQAITEMAVDLGCDIETDDFRILNGCIDNAIAGAVTAFAEGHQTAIDNRENERQERLSVLRADHNRLVAIALQAFTAMRTGNLGMSGATGSLLLHALTELQYLSYQSVEGEKAETTASPQDTSKSHRAS